MRARVATVALVLALSGALSGCKPNGDGARTPDEPVDGVAGAEEAPVDAGMLAAERVHEPSADTASEPDQPTRPADTIFRSELTRATAGGRPAYLLSQLAPEPYRPGNRFLGWKITRLWPSDPDLCAIGCDLRTGDVVLTVNGKALERPEQLSAIMEEIATVDELRVKSLRDGQLRDRTYTILDDG